MEIANDVLSMPKESALPAKVIEEKALAEEKSLSDANPTDAVAAADTASSLEDATKALSKQTKEEVREPARSDSPIVELVFHIMPAEKHIPSPSPACLKLLTYARMAGKEYGTDNKKPPTKEKHPWMKHKDTVIEDSSFCIEYINKTFDIDLDKELTDEQKGIAQAIIRMCEENLYWVLLWSRMVCDDGAWAKRHVKVHKLGFMNSMAVRNMKKKSASSLQAQGLGRHTAEEIHHIARTDIQALSRILGGKSFFMGEQPTRVDAAAFGLIANFVYEPDGTAVKKMILDEFPNLLHFCDRMKQKFWFDWDDVCKKETDKKAAKSDTLASSDEKAEDEKAEDDKAEDETAEEEQVEERKAEEEKLEEEKAEEEKTDEDKAEEKKGEDDKAEEKKADDDKAEEKKGEDNSGEIGDNKDKNGISISPPEDRKVATEEPSEGAEKTKELQTADAEQLRTNAMLDHPQLKTSTESELKAVVGLS